MLLLALLIVNIDDMQEKVFHFLTHPNFTATNRKLVQKAMSYIGIQKKIMYVKLYQVFDNEVPKVKNNVDLPIVCAHMQLWSTR